VGYGDKTLNLQFANGLIGEVLIMHPEMYKASRGEVASKAEFDQMFPQLSMPNKR